MRLLVLLLLISCSHSGLKYKYSGAQRYLASLTSEDVEVSRIELELKQSVLFASGMDSTYLVARLFDKEGKPLKDVDPNDLTILTNEDLDAKPFVFKQGIFKAELRPYVRSKSIRMRVDWQEKVKSPEIVLKMTTSPLKDELELVNHHHYQSPRIGDGRGSSAPTDGFSLENTGDNRIVDNTKNPQSQRVFSFDYPEQARQNISLEVYDAPNSTVSHTMHSLFWFFPRKNLPMVEQLQNEIKVYLPTGEEMIFHKDSKEIIGGVFTEGPMDSTKDRFKRHYPDLKYRGRGVVLRVNSRGQSPQLGQFEKNKIDMEFGISGSVDVLIINGTTGEKCQRPKTDFWEPIDVSPIEFKFSNDEEFDLYLRNNCGFGLPNF